MNAYDALIGLVKQTATEMEKEAAMTTPDRLTLQKIRKHSPCEDGWAKLLAHLGKTKADDEPLSLATVLDSNGLADALWCLRALHGLDGPIRLLACDFAERALGFVPTEEKRPAEAIRVARLYAAGKATPEELDAAGAAAWAAAGAAAGAAAWAAAVAARAAAEAAAAWAAAWDAAWAAGDAAGDAARAAARDAAWAAAGDAAWAAAWAAGDAAGDAAEAAERKAQTKIFREWIKKNGV